MAFQFAIYVDSKGNKNIGNCERAKRVWQSPRQVGDLKILY